MNPRLTPPPKAGQARPKSQPKTPAQKTLEPGSLANPLMVLAEAARYQGRRMAATEDKAERAALAGRLQAKAAATGQRETRAQEMQAQNSKMKPPPMSQPKARG